MRSSLGWKGRSGFSPRTGPKASMSGFQILAQFRPDPVVMPMVMPIAPTARDGVLDLQELLAKGRLPFWADIGTGDLSGELRG